MAIERIEVYLNNSAQPVQVLTQAPFKVKLDTRSLPDGEHTLKTVTHYSNGTKDVKEIPFKVANTPGVLVQGLEEGKEVSGDLDVTLRVADSSVRPQRERFPGTPFVIATVAVLGLVWGFFAINPGLTQDALKEVTAPAKAGEAYGGAAAAPAGPVDAALLKSGETIYASSGCVGCHQPTGAGLPPAMPALAGNSKVGDLKHVVQWIRKGNGAMPAFPQLSANDLAAVSTYIRNSWGNKFGGASVEEVEKLLKEIGSVPGQRVLSSR
ncbi:MAG: c-type cytochrome [Meiothermus sp.]|nr:c-type cytochrome [Meiothermus sp.]